MLENHTTLCQTFGQPEIVLALDDQFGFDPVWLIDFFEKSVAGGRRFKANETVQVGWMLLLLKASGSNTLDAWEPRLDSFPIKWVRGIDNTIRHLILQKSVAELFKVEPAFPSLRQSGLATKYFLTLNGESRFRMVRLSDFRNDSGWRFDGVDEADQDEECHSLFKLSLLQRNIIPFLALPKGAKVTKIQNTIQLEFEGVILNSHDLPFLQELARTSTS